MSNIYIQEPPTSGKVLLKTSVGDIDIELWCRETPKTCRNFIQLCMEGYYNDTIFHRLVKGFIVQGGDPSGDGTGGESVYGATFKDEFHSRLRFIRRGLVAMANAGRDDNGSQFFFTLGEATELQNKHTLFGKITGDTVFNMLKLEDGVVVDHNEKPLYPHRILKTEVLLNPFDDIQPRVVERKRSDKEKKKKEKGVKNFGLLSFGNEAEEDEQETTNFVQKNSGKAKSTHDVLDDPKLSKDTATFVKIEKEDETDALEHDNDEDRTAALTDSVRNKLQTGRSKDGAKKRVKDKEPPKKKVAKPSVPAEEEIVVSDSGSDDLNNELERERRIKRKKAADEIRDQICTLKKEYQKDKRAKDAATSDSAKAKAEHVDEETAKPASKMFQDYLSEQRKYADRRQDVPKKKDAAHEQQTLELLARFKSKLNQVSYASSGEENDDEGADIQRKERKPAEPVRAINSDNEDDIAGDNWLSHTLRFEEKAPVLAKDASTKKDDWYDAFDPRNPLNKRKRGDEGKQQRRDGGKRSAGGSSNRR